MAGEKKHSQDMYETPQKLDWGTTEFNLLGLQFSVDLNKIPAMNYSLILNKIEKILIRWRRRNLTPVGKITVLKTFVLSSLNHVFASLPSPDKQTISSLNKLMYSFLWDNKPSKISRDQITNDFFNGGLKMIDLDNFVRAQKLAWVKRLILSPDSPWSKLFSSTVSPDKFYLMGSLWSKILANTMSNPFWKEVLMGWGEFLDKKTLSPTEALSSPMWYNSGISTEPLFFSHWYNAGICVPLDIMQNGSLMELADIQCHYNLKSNFLEYLRIQICLKQFFGKCDIHNFSIDRPIFPPYLKTLLNNNKGSRYFYKILKDQYDNKKLKSKWTHILNTDISKKDWNMIYKICFKTLK